MKVPEWQYAEQEGEEEKKGEGQVIDRTRRRLLLMLCLYPTVSKHTW